QLQGVQAVAGAPHQAEAELLPGRHGTDRLPELVLVVRDDHRILRFSRHGGTVLSLGSGPRHTGRRPVVWDYYTRPRGIAQMVQGNISKIAALQRRTPPPGRRAAASVAVRLGPARPFLLHIHAQILHVPLVVAEGVEV